ncbi:unnamed protein product [Phyllotreta striolata]|uniref:Uncharacterized protein n=1 Tax=Phyllotreta striolata TaxID=444603 RepID=A0A9N9XSY5_PHYSR|nr:unnamed protein product [Phyllotreta striolata]
MPMPFRHRSLHCFPPFPWILRYVGINSAEERHSRWGSYASDGNGGVASCYLYKPSTDRSTVRVYAETAAEHSGAAVRLADCSAALPVS